ncbi:MAG: hypothetical protein QNJ90_08360 [Planctomycetota bacterium]|nr:hypothetical protein [Planctomycetota bacterium]
MSRSFRPLALLFLLLVAACGAESDVPASELVGTWLLDRDRLARTLLAERVDALDAAARKALTAEGRRSLYTESRKVAGESDLRLDVMEDGTFVVRYRFGREQGARKGEWRREDGRLVMRTTETATGPLARPHEVRCTLADGLLVFPATDAVPHAFSLRRR